MMINSFENYKNAGKVKKKTPDPEESSDLLKKAEERIKYASSRSMDQDSAKFVLEDAYEAAREAAQSLMSLKGYKPYSHEATISFLKEFFNEYIKEEEISEFDRIRQMRNDSIYKAIEISSKDAMISIEFAKRIIKKISRIT